MVERPNRLPPQGGNTVPHLSPAEDSTVAAVALPFLARWAGPAMLLSRTVTVATDSVAA